jgi:hypothetical protein
MSGENLKINKRNTAANERFGASGAVTRPKVCADLQVLRPSERQWKPRLPQAANTLCASRARHEQTERMLVNRKYYE